MFKAKFPWTQVAVGFVIGAATGAITALLLAPTTGRKLQKQIRNVYEDQIDNVDKMIKKVANA
jgi:gas vesicle protein